MARVSLADLMKHPPAVDAAKLDALTEADLRAQRIADGYDPEAGPPDDTEIVLPLRQVRSGLGMTQAQLAAVIGIPVALYCDWETGRAMPDPVARTLFKVLAREPVAALRALGHPVPDAA